MKEGKGSGGTLFDDGAENNAENWTVYQMIRYIQSEFLVSSDAWIIFNPGLIWMIYTTWPGPHAATTFSLAGTST